MRANAIDRNRARTLVEHGCISRVDACEGKTAYLNKNDARHAAKHLSRKNERRFETYRCPFCTNWHLTRLSHGE